MATMLRDVPIHGLSFLTYNFVKDSLMEAEGTKHGEESPFIHFFAGVCTGLNIWFWHFP